METGRQKASSQAGAGIGQLWTLRAARKGSLASLPQGDLGNDPRSVPRAVHLLVFTQCLGSG